MTGRQRNQGVKKSREIEHLTHDTTVLRKVLDDLRERNAELVERLEKTERLAIHRFDEINRLRAQLPGKGHTELNHDPDAEACWCHKLWITLHD